jgi:hypothetical protein
MKKAKSSGAGMRREYNRTDFPAGLVRGKYAVRIATGTNMVRLKPSIAAAFPTSEAVNAALASLLRKQKAAAKGARSAERTPRHKGGSLT